MRVPLFRRQHRLHRWTSHALLLRRRGPARRDSDAPTHRGARPPSGGCPRRPPAPLAGVPPLVSGDMPVSGCAYEDRTVFGRFRELALRSGLQAWSAALPGRQFDGLGTAGWTGQLFHVQLFGHYQLALPRISGLAAMAWPVHRPSVMRHEQPAFLDHGRPATPQRRSMTSPSA